MVVEKPAHILVNENASWVKLMHQLEKSGALVCGLGPFYVQDATSFRNILEALFSKNMAF